MTGGEQQVFKVNLGARHLVRSVVVEKTLQLIHEALRRQCNARGGFLTVLRQPPGQALAAWEDAASRPMIEAVKRAFDPRQQLARGRLPGVNPQALL